MRNSIINVVLSEDETMRCDVCNSMFDSNTYHAFEGIEMCMDCGERFIDKTGMATGKCYETTIH